MSVLIIAEAGVNHNGSITLAKKMVDAAVQMGADVIKFQTYIPENLVTQSAPMAAYQKKNTDDASQYAMLKKLALSFAEFEELAAYCRKRGIAFLSTPFDMDSIDFLSGMDMPFWKIPSGEITNYPYLAKIASLGAPMMLSTGMCDLAEVEAAVALCREKGSKNITLLHCTTEYPAPADSVNLCALDTLRTHFPYPVGYSDHTKGILAAVAAVAHGATVIEKHFTLDSAMEGPDHRASLEPAEFAEMVRAVRAVEEMLGDGKKEPSPAELPNRAVARKSIVAAKDIAAGEIFSPENLTTKRPGDGICPMRWPQLLGKTATRNYGKDEQIDDGEL